MSEKKTILKNKPLKIVPKCVVGDRTTLGHSALGFLLPCCWVDYKAFSLSHKLTPEHEALYNENLHLDNVKDTKEITDSKEWKEFWDIMFDDPENAPEPCKSKCGVREGEELRNWSEQEEHHYDKPKYKVIKKDNNTGYVGS